MRKEILFDNPDDAAREASRHTRCKLERVTVTMSAADILTKKKADIRTKWKLTLFNRDKVI